MASKNDTGSAIAFGDYNVLSFSLVRPFRGVWMLEAEIDVGDDAAPTGAQVLSFTVANGSPITYACTVIDSSVHVGRATVFAVAGTAGLREHVIGRDYGEIAPRLAVEDILADPVTAAGVERPEFADEVALAALDALPKLPHWSRPAGTGTAALSRLVETIGAGWRVLPSGRVRVAVETWPAWPGGQPYYIDEPDARGIATLALESPDLAPGMTILPPDDQAEKGAGPLRVSDVIHSVDEGGRFRTRVRVMPAERATAGRTRGEWTRAVRGALPPLSLRVPWPATVVSQDADLTLGLRLDEIDGAPFITLSGVPIWPGLPGYQVEVPSGARCMVEFMGGDERYPVVRNFAPGTSVTRLRFDGGNAGFARVGDSALSNWYTIVPAGLGYTLNPAPPGASGAFQIVSLINSGSEKFKG